MTFTMERDVKTWPTGADAALHMEKSSLQEVTAIT